MNNILIKKFKNVNEYPDFEQNYFSGTTKRICKIGHDSVGLMKWLAFYDRSFL